MFIIFASSLTLTFQDVNMKTDSTGQNVLNYLDYFFTLFFIFEMLLKWFGNGLKRYFTDPWSILDFFIVIVS
jgi:voltage-gated cation channel